MDGHKDVLILLNNWNSTVSKTTI